MSKIIGIGLPRTGGTTLAAALRKFDIHGENTCIVTNVKTTTKAVKKAPAATKFVINNEFPHQIATKGMGWFRAKNKFTEMDKYILTTRGHAGWTESLAKFGGVEGEGEIPFKDEYEEYILNYGDLNSHNLLIINWNDCNDNCWDRIADFLGKPRIVDEEFPCENC